MQLRHECRPVGVPRRPLAAELFRFGPLHPDDLALTAASGVVVFACLELIKHMRGAWGKT